MFSRIQPLSNSNSRKRQKRAHSPDSDSKDGPSPPRPTPAMPVACVLPHTSGSAGTAGEPQTCHHQQALQRLEPDLDAMRQLITCKICQRFLSEPYGLACGHTYCYVCLDAWLVAQRKRTCPDCRATIKTQPVPSFLIREMTRVFAYRAELLPDGETVDEHDEYIKEAVGKVSRDKQNGGLFSGLFKHGEQMQWMPLHDPGDEVDRCPNCHWELEEGRCGSCGLTIGDQDGFGSDSESELESSGDEQDHALMPHDDDGLDDGMSFDEEDFLDEDGGNGHAGGDHDEIDYSAFGVLPAPPNRRVRHRHEPINLEEDEEQFEDSEDAENDPQMEGFLDDEEPEDSGSDSSREQSDSEEEAEESPRHERPRHRQLIRPITVEDSDDDAPRQARRPVVIHSDDSDEDGPVAPNRQRLSKVVRGARRPQQVQTISSDEDTSDDENDNRNMNANMPRYPQRNEYLHRDESMSQDDAESVPGSDEEGVGIEDLEEYQEGALGGFVEAHGFSPLQSEVDDDDDEEGNYGDGMGAYGVHDDFGVQEQSNDEDGDEDEEDEFPDFGTEQYHEGNAYDQGQYVNYDGEGSEADDDGGRNTRTEMTPPPSTRPIESTLTHRLSKRQLRRRRSANRDSGAISAAGLVEEAVHQQVQQQQQQQQHQSPDPELDLDEQLMWDNQGGIIPQRPARMRRVQGRDSLRSANVGSERRRRR